MRRAGAEEDSGPSMCIVTPPVLDLCFAINTAQWDEIHSETNNATSIVQMLKTFQEKRM